jgi:hypothetical protein
MQEPLDMLAYAEGSLGSASSKPFAFIFDISFTQGVEERMLLLKPLSASVTSSTAVRIRATEVCIGQICADDPPSTFAGLVKPPWPLPGFCSGLLWKTAGCYARLVEFRRSWLQSR